MLFAYYFVVFLPVLSYGLIEVTIKIAIDPYKSTVSCAGDDVSIISDKERAAFQFDDESLKQASLRYSGKRCSDMYVSDPTPWGDVFPRYGWDQVERTIRPVRARIVDIDAPTVVIATREDFNDQPYLITKKMVSQNVSYKLTHNWSIPEQLDGQDVKYYIVKLDDGTSESWSHISAWGANSTQERKVILGSNMRDIFDIPPGGDFTDKLLVTRGTLTIDIDYEATIDGDVFCNYADKYKGHHFWAYRVENLQEVGSLPKIFKSTERVSLYFYNNGKIHVYDTTTGAIVKTVTVGITGG